jgi:hypothetical protein
MVHGDGADDRVWSSARITGAQLCQRVDGHAWLQLVQKMRPRVGKTDGIAGINFEDGLQSGVKDSQMDGLLVGLDYMYPAFIIMSVVPIAAGLVIPSHAAGLRELTEPRPHRRQHSHEAAGTQQLAAGAAASGQVTVQLLLVDFVHVQETVCRPRVESGIFNVFAEHPGALFIAASKQVSAVAMTGRGMVFLIVLFRHVVPTVQFEI